MNPAVRDMTAWAIFFTACIAMGGSAPPREIEFFVSPNGSDQGDGTRQMPFATPSRARDAARGAKAAHATAPITVWLKGGQYDLSAPLELTAADSGSAEAPIVYRAIEGETPRLIGARRLGPGDFMPIRDRATLERLPEAVRDRVLELDLKALNVHHNKIPADVFSDSGGLPDLFIAGRRMPLARYPNEGYMTIERVLDTAGGTQGTIDFMSAPLREGDGELVSRAAALLAHCR